MESSFENASLARIEKAVEDRTLIERIQAFNQHKDMYAIAHAFIQKHGLILFGGYALNSIFPTEKKFYDAYELPDYDVFSPAAEKHAQDLADIYRGLGYHFVEVRHALHLGSFKLFVEFKSMVDFRHTPKPLYDRYLKMSKQQVPAIQRVSPDFDASLQIAPLDFLRFAVHHELSEPHGEVARWTKVYRRFAAFYQLYPFTYDAACEKDLLQPIAETANASDKTFVALLDAIVAYGESKGLPYVGTSAIALIEASMQPTQATAKSGKSAKSAKSAKTAQTSPQVTLSDPMMGCVEFLSENAKDTIEELFPLLKTQLSELLSTKAKAKTKTSGIRLTLKQFGEFGPDEHNTPCYIIFLHRKNEKKQALVTIHQTVSCHSIVKLGQLKIANLDTLIRFLFHYIFVPQSAAVDEKRKCLINRMYRLLFPSPLPSPTYTPSRSSSSSPTVPPSKLLARFVLDCYGYQPSLDSARRLRAARLSSASENKKKLKKSNKQ